MRRYILGFILVLALLCGRALAEERANPRRAHVLADEALISRLIDAGELLPRDVETRFRLHAVVEPTLEGETVWEMEYLTDSTDFQFEFYVLERQSVFGTYSAVIHRDVGADTRFSATLTVPGDYYVAYFTYVPNGAGGYVRESNSAVGKRFSVAEDGVHPTLEAIVAEVAAQCRADTLYETAYRLHDWLVDHANYDHTHTYYGADGVLTRGVGVCDSYSKAFYFLCQAAGIPVARVESREMNHAWNVLQLEGGWYQVDVTWDDSDWTSASFGAHRYCAISDALMRLNHTYTSPYACDTLADNYYVRMGGWEEWCPGFLPAVTEALTAGAHSLRVATGRRVYHSGAATGADPAAYFPIAAWAASRLTWPVPEGVTGQPVFAYRADTGELTVRLRPEGEALRLPQAVTHIGEEAFAGIAARQMVVSSGCRSIGSRAFADSGLWEVTLPATVQSITDDAFQGVPPGLIIHAPAGSAAAAWALRMGLWVEE